MMSDDIKALQYVIMEKDRIIEECDRSFKEYNDRIWKMKKTIDAMELNVDHSRLDAYNDIKHKNFNLQCKIDNLKADNERLKRKQRKECFDNALLPLIVILSICAVIGFIIGCVV